MGWLSTEVEHRLVPLYNIPDGVKVTLIHLALRGRHIKNRSVGETFAAHVKVINSRLQRITAGRR